MNPPIADDDESLFLLQYLLLSSGFRLSSPIFRIWIEDETRLIHEGQIEDQRKKQHG